MKKELLLTVNVVTYNHAKYISQCLDSILEQKTKFKFIIRIFDDCSTDDTLKICQKYKEKYRRRIQIFPNEKNMGPSLNARRSYKDIETPFYLFIEGDDYRINKEGFQKQVDALLRHPECSFCAAKTIDFKGNEMKAGSPWQLETGIYTSEDVTNKHDIYWFTHIGTRIVRTKCIHIGDVLDDYQFDHTQFYELMDQGKMYFINEDYMVYNVTYEGLYTSLSCFKRLEYLIKQMGNYSERNDKYILNYLNIIRLEAEWIFREKVQEKNFKHIPAQQIPCIEKKRNNVLKRIRVLFVPKILLIIAHGVRDVVRYLRYKKRFIRAVKFIRDLFIPEIFLIVAHGVRDFVRDLRRRF